MGWSAFPFCTGSSGLDVSLLKILGTSLPPITESAINALSFLAPPLEKTWFSKVFCRLTGDIA